jgi:hypothetical protein
MMRSPSRTACVAALFLGAVVACTATDAVPAGPAAPAGTDIAGLADLGASLGPLRAWFAAHRDQPRALALLSPT